MSAAISAAVGLTGALIGSNATKKAARTSAAAADRATEEGRRQYNQNRQDLMPWMDVARGAEIKDADGNITGYEGGALNQLADYGGSKVLQGDYIPYSDIPKYSDYQDKTLPEFNVNGDVSQFNSNFDITKDPSYQFRKSEQDRSINRNMAGMGKLFSGNRLEELMSRSGQIASQEYGAADSRNRNDYTLNRASEDAQYGRGLTKYNADAQNNQLAYDRNADSYTQDLQREGTLRNRGISDFGRSYGIEQDNLNRLASLSNIGQNAVTNVANMGTRFANNAGNNIIAAGNTRAAAQIGQGAAWQNAIGDFMQYQGGKSSPPPQQNAFSYNSPNLSFNPSPQNFNFMGNN